MSKKHKKGLWFFVIALLCAIALTAMVWLSPRPFLIWNASRSVPIGWYWIQHRPPNIHEIAVVKLDDWPALYADARGYLPSNVWLLKPVAVVFPGVVCRFGRYVLANGKLIAKARIFDSRKRVLPQWKGCRMLKFDEVFLIARPSDSFDSRYFGPLSLRQVIGVAHRMHLPFE